MVKNEKKIKVGLVGTGKMAQRHAEAFLSIKNAELAAVYSQSLIRAQKFAQKYRIKAYDNLDNFLNHSELKIVDITGIHSQHADIGIKAAQAGKHIITEKPMDISVDKAKELIQECRKNNVSLCTVFQHRFDQAVKELKEKIEAGQLGELFLGSVQMRWPREQGYYEAGNKWRKKKTLAGGGVLINQAIHRIDALCYLMGEVVSVYGETQIATHDIEVEDVGVGIVRFKNNALGVVQGTVSTVFRWPNIIEIHGTRGSAIIEGETLTIKTKEKNIIEKFQENFFKKIFSRLPFILKFKIKKYQATHKDYLKEVVQALWNNELPPVSFEEGLKSLEVVEAIYRSSDEKKLIKLRETDQQISLDRNKYYKKIIKENEKNKIKVLLINPLNITKANIESSHIGKPRPRQPLDLAYCAAFLKKKIETKLLDAAVLGWDTSVTVDLINTIKPEILIISSTPLDRWQNPDLDISNIFNIINQSLVKNIILIGSHGTVTPNWIFDNCKANFIIRGEPEITCLELVERILNNNEKDFFQIKGLSYRFNNQTFHNPDRIFDSELNNYPWPAYDDLPMSLYRYTTKDLPPPFSLMLTSRGCPYKCIFCLKKMMPSRYRARMAENILEEIKYLKNKFQIKSIYFQDWEFLIDKERVERLCNLLIKDKVNIFWGCSARVNNLEPKLINLMKRAGCTLINFGYESGSYEILVKSNKGIALEQIKNAVKLCQDNDINIRSFCLVNLPGETKQTIRESAKFIVKNNLNVPHINFPIPYPGTEIAKAINCNSWQEATERTGKIETVLKPVQARKLLKKYIWRERFGRLYFFNFRFLWHIAKIIKKKFF